LRQTPGYRVTPLSIAMNDETDKQRQLALYIAESTSAVERAALITWAEQLLEIRKSGSPPHLKAMRALELTGRSKVILPVAKLMWKEIKRHAWDERGLKSRFGVGTAAIAGLMFGGQGAGIAAFGTAIGVPLWIVFGAGGAFAGMFLEELLRKSKR